MKKYFLISLLLAAIQGAWAWDGSGTQANTYQIKTTDDWNTLCLPFNVSLTGDYAGATLMELDTSTGTYTHDTGIDGSTLYLNFDDETVTTGILTMEDGKWKIEDAIGTWYTLDGRKLSGRPTQRGMYIHNGKTVVVKQKVC